MLKRFLILFLGLFIIITACSDDDNPAETQEQIVEFNLVESVGNQYFSSYTSTSGKSVNISIADVKTLLTDGDTSNDPYIIDYRSAADFASGHIISAVNMAIGDLVTKINDGTIPKTKTILNICYTGQTASWATAVLNMLGYDAQNLLFAMCSVVADNSINGTDKWINQIAGDEFATQLKTTDLTPTTEHAYPTLSTGKTSAEDIIKERITSILAADGWGRIDAATVFSNPGNYFIINYWPKAEYLNPGHIEGAFCYEPKTSLKKDAMLKYLPTDKTIVIYCYTGQTSAQIAAYLQILGYDAKSLLYGVNGFAYNSLTKSKYTPPAADYSDIIIK